MHVKDLVGKRAVRTEPTKRIGDYSFTSNPLLILKVTEHHIVCKYCFNYLPSREQLLNLDFVDDNWVDYDDLVGHIWIDKLRAEKDLEEYLKTIRR